MVHVPALCFQYAVIFYVSLLKIVICQIATALKPFLHSKKTIYSGYNFILNKINRPQALTVFETGRERNISGPE